jgi:hypothetical protein
MDLILRNARLTSRPGQPRCDIGIEGGRIAAIAPTLPAEGQELDVQGRLVSAGFVETHIHLDKSCLLDRCTSEKGDLDEAIEQVAAVKKQFTAADVRARATRTLEQCILHGTTLMRTHLEVDPGIGLRGLEGVLPLIEAYKWAMDIEICVFTTGTSQVFCSFFAGIFQVRCAHVLYAKRVWSTLGRLRRSVAAVGVPRAGLACIFWRTLCHSILYPRLPTNQFLRLGGYGSRPIRQCAIAAGGRLPSRILGVSPWWARCPSQAALNSSSVLRAPRCATAAQRWRCFGHGTSASAGGGRQGPARDVCNAEFVTVPPTPFQYFQWSQAMYEWAVMEAGFKYCAWHPTVNIPKNFARTIVELYGEAGRTWLARLPSLITEYAQQWSLTVV